MQPAEIVKRFIRIENQIEALRRAELVILEELVGLHQPGYGPLDGDSVGRLNSQLEALKSLKPRKNGDR